MGDILGKAGGRSGRGDLVARSAPEPFSQCVGGGLRANVVDGVLVGFGLEPVDGPDVTAPVPRATTSCSCGRRPAAARRGGRGRGHRASCGATARA